MLKKSLKPKNLVRILRFFAFLPLPWKGMVLILILDTDTITGTITGTDTGTITGTDTGTDTAWHDTGTDTGTIT